MSGRVNITELGERFGIPRNRARILLSAAGVQRDAYRHYDEDQAVEVLSSHVDPARVAAHHALGLGSDAITSNRYADARVISETARAEKLRQDVDIRAGKLVDRQTVIEAGKEFASTIRTSMLGIPAKIAGRLVGKTREEIVAALDTEVRHALSDLADVDHYIIGGAP